MDEDDQDDEEDVTVSKLKEGPLFLVNFIKVEQTFYWYELKTVWLGFILNCCQQSSYHEKIQKPTFQALAICQSQYSCFNAL